MDKETKELAKIQEKQELTAAEKTQVIKLKESININDANGIIFFGAAAQRKTADFVDSILASTKTKDINEAGEILNDLMLNLKGFEANLENKGIVSRLFSNAKKRLEKLQNNYRSVENNIDRIVSSLEQHRKLLMQNNSMLDKLYEKNIDYIEELKLYIAAGEDKIGEINNEVLPALKTQAEQSGDQLVVQTYKDTLDALDRIERKVHDLKLTRTVSLQSLPQIRLQQGSNNVLVDKIHSSIVNAIPLWKGQMVIALGLAQTSNALKAQKAVSDTTNELLRKNSEMLKTSTIEAAKESERSLIDIQTISKANQDIITSIQEVANIHKEGKIKRQEAEKELTRLENELKQNILGIMEK